MELVQQLKSQTREAYDWIAENYAIEWARRADKQIIERFLEIVPNQSRVLDIGCGPAHYAKIFSESGLTTFGIDFSPGMLSQAIQNWHDGKIAQMDMQNMGFPAHWFDALWTCTSFAHIPELVVPQTLSELRRVLKPGGILFINVTINSPSIRIETAEEMGVYNKQGRFYQRYPSRQYFENYLHSASFAVIDVVPKTVYTSYNAHNFPNRIAPKSEYKVNQWVNFYCINTGK